MCHCRRCRQITKCGTRDLLVSHHGNPGSFKLWLVFCRKRHTLTQEVHVPPLRSSWRGDFNGIGMANAKQCSSPPKKSLQTLRTCDAFWRSEKGWEQGNGRNWRTWWNWRNLRSNLSTLIVNGPSALVSGSARLPRQEDAPMAQCLLMFFGYPWYQFVPFLIWRPRWKRWKKLHLMPVMRLA